MVGIFQNRNCPGYECVRVGVHDKICPSWQFSGFGIFSFNLAKFQNIHDGYSPTWELSNMEIMHIGNCAGRKLSSLRIVLIVNCPK